LYFATYFDRRNQQCESLLKKAFSSDFTELKAAITEFTEIWDSENDQDPQQYAQLNTINKYSELCKQSEDATDPFTKSAKLSTVLTHTHIFCVPWLLSYQDIFDI